MLSQRQRQACINDMSISGITFGNILPQLLGNCRMIIDATPIGVGFQRVAVSCRFGSGVWLFENCGVAKQNENLHKDQFAHHKFLTLGLHTIKKRYCLIMRAGVRISSIDK